jgi:MFS transporter, AAHS family, 4-hydroxybenzoate transporter
MASGQVVDVARIIDEQKMGPLHWQVVALAFVLMLIDGYDIVCVAYVAPLLRQQWGFPPAALGPLFGSGLLGAALGPIIFGYLGDKIGRKPTILAGALWFGIFTTAAVWATSLNQLMLLRLIAGFGIGGVLGIVTALVSEFAPRRIRGTMVVMGVVGVALGGGIGGVLAAQLMGTYGWQIVFWIGGLVPIVLAVIGYFIFPESIKFLTLRPHRRAELLALLGRLSPGLKIDPDARLVLGDEANAPSFSFKALFDGRLAWVTPLLWISNFLALFQLFFVNQWTPILLANQGVPLTRTALATASFQIFGFLGAIAIMRPVDKLGFLPVPILFVLAIPVIALIGLPGLSDTAVIALAGAAGFCVIGIQFGNIATQSQVYPTYIRSWGVGTCFGIGRFGSVVGPVLAGILIGMNLSINTLFYFAGALMILGVVVGIALVPLYRQQLEDLQKSGAPIAGRTEGLKPAE